MEFLDLLLLAKQEDKWAIQHLYQMYRPLLIKTATINGVFDEDLYHELIHIFLLCIKKINP